MRKITSPMWFLNRDFIIFICEKERSTEAIPTVRVRHTFARVLKAWTQYLTLNLWTIYSTAHSYPPSAYLLCIFKKFSTPLADQMKSSIANSTPPIDSAGSSQPWCWGRLWCFPHHMYWGLLVGLVVAFASKMLKDDIPSWEINRFWILSFNEVEKGVATRRKICDGSSGTLDAYCCFHFTFNLL